MNKINSIYTTVSRSQVHIAADTKYIGSVDSYNNCFTQFFAWLFGLSMAVNFDGKVRSVNKESYTNLIRSLTQNNEINDIRQRSLFRPIAEAAALPAGNLKMRDVITTEDRQALFKKLAIAISRGETTKALLMIGKGAELDGAYFDRDQLPPSFSRDISDLNANSRYIFTVFYAAPILQAAQKGNRVVCQFLKDAGANLSVSGNQYTFKREIIDVENRLEVVPMSRLVRHRVIDSNGHKRYKDRYHPTFGLQERTIVTTQDSRSAWKDYQLNQVDLSIIEV